MSLQEQIDALPEWPDIKDMLSACMSADVIEEVMLNHQSDRVDAALARLALAREWIEREPHANRCPWRNLAQNAAGFRPACTCGRDALLKALELGDD
jgi:hypothetical protein